MVEHRTLILAIVSVLQSTQENSVKVSLVSHTHMHTHTMYPHIHTHTNTHTNTQTTTTYSFGPTDGNEPIPSVVITVFITTDTANVTKGIIRLYAH